MLQLLTTHVGEGGSVGWVSGGVEPPSVGQTGSCRVAWTSLVRDVLEVI